MKAAFRAQKHISFNQERNASFTTADMHFAEALSRKKNKVKLSPAGAGPGERVIGANMNTLRSLPI